MILIDGDHDVFDDGSITLMLCPKTSERVWTAGGQGFPSVEDVAIPDVSVLGEYERGDSGDVVRVDDGLTAGVGGIDNAVVLADPVRPLQCV